jgi:hypothetical protein
VAIKVLDRAKLLAKEGSEAKVNMEIDILGRSACVCVCVCVYVCVYVCVCVRMYVCACVCV